MRVVAVSRIMNEADVVEPFLRHTAVLLDHHIVLDNGSTDGTLEILSALKEEGLSLEVYQTVSPIFLEAEYNTGLYQLAHAAGADWVLFLDADELLFVTDAARPADILAAVPTGIDSLRVPAFDYLRPERDPHPFMRLSHRRATPDMFKIALRRLDPSRVSVYPGNHFAFIDGRQEIGLTQTRLWLAHVPDRGPLHVARKSILARMKVVASGKTTADDFSVHRQSDVDDLQRDPAAWLAAAAEPKTGVEHPVPYLGGPLRYTQPADDIARLLSLFSIDSERLARSHGAILDAKRLIRQDMRRRGAEIRRLF